MSIFYAIAAGLMIAFALAGVVVCFSFPSARLVMWNMRKAVVTRRNLALRLLSSFAIIAFLYHFDRSKLWLWVILLVLAVVETAIKWPRAAHQ